MSFSFKVPVSSPPPFASVLAAAALPWPIALHGVSDEAGDWPRGRLYPVSDLTYRPFPMLGDPVPGSGFLVHAPGRSSRGVQVTQQSGSVVFDVPLLSSPEDFEIAVRLAAGLAGLTGTEVKADHGPHHESVDPMSAQSLLAQFDRVVAGKLACGLNDAFLKNMLEGMPKSMAEAIVKAFPDKAEDKLGKPTYFAYAPRGWVRLRSQELAETAGDSLCERARELLRQPRPRGARDIARLLVRAIGVKAIGRAAGSRPKGQALVALGHASLRELRDFDPDELVREMEASDPGLIDLRHELPKALTKKAFMLSAEMIAVVNQGRLTSDVSWLLDGQARPPPWFIDALANRATRAGLDPRETHSAQLVKAVASTLMHKYAELRANPTPVDLRILAEALVFVGARWDARLEGLLQPVPEVRSATDFGSRFAIAESRSSLFPNEVLEDFSTLSPGLREKCFVLACEAGLSIAPRDQPMRDRLSTLARALKVADSVSSAAMLTFETKYASDADLTIDLSIYLSGAEEPNSHVTHPCAT